MEPLKTQLEGEPETLLKRGCEHWAGRDGIVYLSLQQLFFFSVSLTLACEQVVQKEPRINEWIQLLFQSCSTCENGVIVKVFEGGESPVEVGLRLA